MIRWLLSFSFFFVVVGGEGCVSFLQFGSENFRKRDRNLFCCIFHVTYLTDNLIHRLIIFFGEETTAQSN